MNNRIIFEQEYANTQNTVVALDEPGNGGASHNYQIRIELQGADESLTKNISFQDGPTREVGLNGIQNIHLLAILIDTLKGFQSGPYACQENEVALTKLEEAMHWLEARTKDRTDRGVEGLNQK